MINSGCFLSLNFCIKGAHGLIQPELPPTGDDENDRDFGIVKDVGITIGELGEGLFDRDSEGLEPGDAGVVSRLCLKLELRVLQSSVSSVGSPVADVVVVQVLIDIRRNKLGGRLRRRRWKETIMNIVTLCMTRSPICLWKITAIEKVNSIENCDQTKNN